MEPAEELSAIMFELREMRLTAARTLDLFNSSFYLRLSIQNFGVGCW
jgi:hypothetical protein